MKQQEEENVSENDFLTDSLDVIMNQYRYRRHEPFINNTTNNNGNNDGISIIIVIIIIITTITIMVLLL